MSEHVNALILIGHSGRVVADVPEYVHGDVDQDLSYINNGKKEWYDGEPITELDKANVYTSDVFLKLGRLTASIYHNEAVSFIADTNTCKFPTIEAIQSISLLKEGTTLALPCDIDYWSSELQENGLPRTFAAALAQDPSLFAELTSKWAIAQEIHAKRGDVTIPAYNIGELIAGLGGLNLDEIAPRDITGSTYNIGDIIDHTSVETHLTNFPYYTTFNIRTNAAQMLDSALEDLKLVSEAIK